MLRKEYIREVAGSDTVVLMIHGILGTPNHFNRLLPYIPKNWSIHNILLDGHGKTILDFAKTSMEKWEQQVDAKMTELSKKYSNIILVGHSMGTLLAMEASFKWREYVKLLYLINVPMRVGLKPHVITNSLKVALNCVRPKDRLAMAEKESYSILPDKRMWLYVTWIPRYLELFAKMRKMRKQITDIKQPCYVFQSWEDELVAVRSVKDIRRNTSIHLSMLWNSGHYYYSPKDEKRIGRGFVKACRRIGFDKICNNL